MVGSEPFYTASWLSPLVTDEESNREALAYCAERLQECPDDGLFWLLKGNSHYRLGELEEAAEAYGQAAELGEVKSHAYFFQAVCLLEIGRFREAVAPLERQIEITPNHGEAIFLLGIALKTMGEKERGNAILKLAKEVDPELYHSLFSKYAEEVAGEAGEDLVGMGLREAVRVLKDQPD